MKTLVSFVALLLCTVTFAQQTKVEYKKMDGNTVKATYYFTDNSQTVQKVGYFNAQGKLHGTWIIYNKLGDKKVEANYRNGKKDGIWIFYKTPEKIKIVTYKDNKIIAHEERDFAVN